MFSVNALSQKPIYEQLIEQTEMYILTEVLKSGDAMPSVRSLSVTSSVNPNTIQKAYSEMVNRGVLVSVPGKGCFVAEKAINIVGTNKRALLEDVKHITKELKLAGVDLQEILSAVKNNY